MHLLYAEFDVLWFGDSRLACCLRCNPTGEEGLRWRVAGILQCQSGGVITALSVIYVFVWFFLNKRMKWKKELKQVIFYPVWKCGGIRSFDGIYNAPEGW